MTPLPDSTPTPFLWRWRKRVPADPASLDRWESLIDEGFLPGASLSEQAGRKTAVLEVFSDQLEAAEDLRRAFGGVVERVDPAALMAVVSGGDPPLKIRDRLIVTGSADAAVIANLERDYPGRQVLSFPPELAFGTGRHATTGTCLRLLADIARERHGEPGWNLLDLGHGSGILAIAGVVLGAERAVGIDHDAFAVEAAHRNAGRHRDPSGAGIAGRCDFSAADLARWRPGSPGRFEVIAANLFADLLVSHLPRIARWLAPRGDLVVSGILKRQIDRVVAAARTAGLAFDRPVVRGKWVAMRGGHAVDRTRTR